jgi:AbiJ N-terminal domain 4
MSRGSFSRRQGYAGQPAEITIREDAPENLRLFVLEAARDLGLRPNAFRDVVCSVLEERPDRSNWSEYPNIWGEVEGHVFHCEWFLVYDIIERICSHFQCWDDAHGGSEEKAREFADALNDFFVRKGIGWQVLNGEIVTRGPEAFEEVVETARTTLEDAGRPTAARHIHDARQALSRRPLPDLPGAAYHSVESLECVARDVMEIPKRHWARRKTQTWSRARSMRPCPKYGALRQMC